MLVTDGPGGTDRTPAELAHTVAEVVGGGFGSV
jgi:hypothetical protein